MSNPISSSLPLAGLSIEEQKEFQRWLMDQSSGASKPLSSNKTMDDIFRSSADADIALAQMAPELKAQLEKGATPTKQALGMLAQVLASTQNDLYDALFQGDNPDWIAQWDPSQRASEKLDELQKQYGFINVK
jgi:hypothetical protein